MLSCCCGTTSRYDVGFFNSQHSNGEKKNVTFNRTNTKTQIHSKVRSNWSEYIGCIRDRIKYCEKGGNHGIVERIATTGRRRPRRCALCFFGYGVGKKLFCDKDAFEEEISN